MAEAPIKWKIKILKEINAASRSAHFVPTPDTKDTDWFIDMKKDGYVEGTWGRIVDMRSTVPGVGKPSALEPVLNFSSKKSVHGKYIPAISWGWQTSERIIRVM